MEGNQIAAHTITRHQAEDEEVPRLQEKNKIGSIYGEGDKQTGLSRDQASRGSGQCTSYDQDFELRVGPGRSGPGTEQDTEAATDSFDRQVTVATLHS